MSKYDIHVIEQQKKTLQLELKKIVRDGTSKGDNRKKYHRIKQRINRLNRWLKEL